jgi:hypothetical protein
MPAGAAPGGGAGDGRVGSNPPSWFIATAALELGRGAGARRGSANHAAPATMTAAAAIQGSADRLRRRLACRCRFGWCRFDIDAITLAEPDAWHQAAPPVVSVSILSV